MDENWSFSDQSEKVKDALKKIVTSFIGKTTKEELENEFVKIQNNIKKIARQKFDGYSVEVDEDELRKQLYKIDSKLLLLKSIEDNNTYYKGKDIYNALSNIVGSDEKASNLLNEYGIKGITYDGKQDGRCYVIFDDKAVEIVQKFYQGKENYLSKKDKLFNSLSDEEKEQIFLKEFIDSTQILKDEKRLENDIENHLKNTMKPKQMINFGLAPIILQEFGIPSKNMLMGRDKYDCSTHRKVVKGSIHNVSDDVMKKLPSLLSNPLIIALPLDDATKKENRLVVTLNEIDNEENLINVILDYDWNGKKVNIIPSVYGKEDFETYLSNCDKQNKYLYIDKKNLLARLPKRQSSRWNSKGSNNIIKYKDDYIKANLDKYKVTLNQGGKEDENDIDYTEYFFGQKKVNLENKEQFDKFIDEFSSEDGMRPEWKDFFTDYGNKVIQIYLYTTILKFHFLLL